MKSVGEIIAEAGGVEAFLERQMAAKALSTSDLLFKAAAALAAEVMKLETNRAMLPEGELTSLDCEPDPASRVILAILN